MNKTTFQAKVRSPDGGVEVVEWPGYDVGVPGLVIHRGITKNRIPNPQKPAKWWTVSHVRSGRRLYHVRFETRRDATKFCSAISNLDWDVSEKTIISKKDTYWPAVEEAYDDVHQFTDSD